ncbi:DMT family transporter [Corynebacterium anserum]|uniref:DMT family transporter n=1 Tax=Corynebacterium anserum TaxID=2684406 RepID=UPI00163A2608|nr:DMT family transporter [Corynebacterium anserum]
MYHNNLLAVFFALLSALTIAWGTVIRHRVAENTAEGVVPIMAAIRSGWWWAGLFGAMAGYGLQIIALRFGTLLIVQPILVLSLMFTLPLSSWMNGRRISKAETAWAGFLTAAVSVIIILGRPAAAETNPSDVVWWSSFCVGTVAISALYLWARRQSRHTRALIFGSLTGAIMGYLALMSKTVVDIWSTEGPRYLVSSWELYMLLFLAATGTAVQQASFNAGDLKNSLPAMTIVEPLIAFSLGYVVLGEHFQVNSTEGWGVMLAAMTVMIGSTVALSRLGVEAHTVEAHANEAHANELSEQQEPQQLTAQQQLDQPGNTTRKIP